MRRPVRHGAWLLVAALLTIGEASASEARLEALRRLHAEAILAVRGVVSVQPRGRALVVEVEKPTDAARVRKLLPPDLSPTLEEEGYRLDVVASPHAGSTRLTRIVDVRLPRVIDPSRVSHGLLKFRRKKGESLDRVEIRRRGRILRIDVRLRGEATKTLAPDGETTLSLPALPTGEHTLIFNEGFELQRPRARRRTGKGRSLVTRTVRIRRGKVKMPIRIPDHPRFRLLRR